MYQDILFTYDDKRDVTSAALGGGIFSVANSPNLGTNSYDAGVAGSPAAGVSYAAAVGIGGPLLHDIGRGRRVKLVVQVTTTLTASGGAASLSVDFVMADNAACSSGKTVLQSSAAIAKANLTAGYRFDFGSIPGKITKEFTNVQYTAVTNTLDAGNISAFIALDVDDHADIIGSV